MFAVGTCIVFNITSFLYGHIGHNVPSYQHILKSKQTSRVTLSGPFLSTCSALSCELFTLCTQAHTLCTSPSEVGASHSGMQLVFSGCSSDHSISVPDGQKKEKRQPKAIPPHESFLFMGFSRKQDKFFWLISGLSYLQKTLGHAVLLAWRLAVTNNGDFFFWVFFFFKCQHVFVIFLFLRLFHSETTASLRFGWFLLNLSLFWEKLSL